jgi:7-cyano-7-deazaguanine synthase in queuosine biosynthesis
LKLTIDNKSIDFFNFNTKNIKIGIGVSGGADSALLLYLAAKYLPDTVIVPWSGYEIKNKVHNYRPFTILDAQNVVQIVKEKLPHANITDHYIWSYDRQGQNKNTYMKNEIDRCLKNKTFDMYVSGITANPPEDILKEISKRLLKDTAGVIDTYRSYYKEVRRQSWYYSPFTNIDKKVIASLYQKYDLMNDLFCVTQSCVGWGHQTNWFTEPCKQCFWCHERKWAFGRYDGES